MVSSLDTLEILEHFSVTGREISSAMTCAIKTASESPVERYQVGAAIFDREGVLARGCNYPPVQPDEKTWEENTYTEHAERAAIYKVAVSGRSCSGCWMAVTDVPCAPCMRAIIQVKIRLLICMESAADQARWAKSQQTALHMANLAGLPYIITPREMWKSF